jgi:hypothetical protein
MLTPLRQWTALGVIAFFGQVALRPALAVAAPAAPEATPPPAAAAPAPAPAPYPPPAPAGTPPPAPYPAPYYGQYPPPGYAPYPQQPYPQYQPYPPLPPPQLVTEHRPRRGLVIGGAVTFGVSWGLAASISLLASDCSTCSGRDSTDVLWIPIAGPVLAGSRDTGSNDSAFWILWSVAELAGVTMFVIGVIGHDVTTYKRVAGRNGPTLQLTPLLARDTSGMALTARW